MTGLSFAAVIGDASARPFHPSSLLLTRADEVIERRCCLLQQCMNTCLAHLGQTPIYLMCINRHWRKQVRFHPNCGTPAGRTVQSEK
jgi:hypothetical protein